MNLQGLCGIIKEASFRLAKVCEDIFMKKHFLLWAAVLLMALTTACGPKEKVIEPVNIDASEVDEYLINLPEYGKIEVTIDKSEFTEELTDDYINRYYERLAEGRENLTDEEGNILPLSEETIKLLDIPAFSTVNEFKVFVRSVVKSFIDKENEDKKLDAALEVLRSDAEFADIPEGYVLKFKERILKDYEELAAGYEITPEYYLELSSVSLEDEALKDAMNELIYIKLAERIGLEYSSDEELYDGVSEYLLSIIKVVKKK